MLNKISKYLLPIILVIAAFFINIKDASAADSCTWYSYQTYIDGTTGNVVNFEPSLRESDGDNMPSVYTLELLIEDRGILKLKISINDKILLKNEVSVTESIYNKTTFKFTCPEYVELSSNVKPVNGGYIKTYALKESNSASFDSYLKNQYSGITHTNSDKNQTGYFVNVLNRISDKNMVFKSAEYTDYETKNYNRLIQIDPNIHEKIKLDGGKSSTKKQYYDASKKMWDDKIEARLEVIENKGQDVYDAYSENEAMKDISQGFYYWFSMVNRFVLEEDIDKFKRYYQFAYFTKYTKQDMKNAMKSFDSFEKIPGLDTELEKLKNDVCAGLCVDQTGTSYTQCMASSTYNDCKKANECSKISHEAAQQSCFDRINMSRTEYYAIAEKNKNRQKEIEQEIEKLEDEIRYSLSKISTTIDIDGVTFEPYRVKCEDVVIFHTIYKIMTIMAPILVIVFGSLDYAKAVMASDEKKMEESKKKFPKRLLLLVLFVAIPTIISIILNFSNGETTLMHCVINGA